MRTEPPQAPASLPQSYQNPWGLLARDLGAVVADLRLQLRAIWRRNRQGELSVPGFWPSSLQPLFWPLLLALLLALPWITWRLLSRGPEPLAPPTSSLVSPEPPAASPNRLVEPLPPPISPSASLSPQPPQPLSAPQQQLELEAVPAVAQTAEAAPLALDPIVEMLAEADPEQLISSAHPEPNLALLRLTLAPGFEEQPLQVRSQWAERWYQRALELGYEHLELVDGQQRPLGRTALVGSGMILLEPLPGL